MANPVGFDVEIGGDVESGVKKATAALGLEGFGILTRIDVHRAFAEKLGRDFRPYVILVACNPALAFRALAARPEAGLLLPCNVVVEQRSPDRCLVRIVDPAEMMKAGGLDRDPELTAVGAEADARLRRVAEALRSAPD